MEKQSKTVLVIIGLLVIGMIYQLTKPVPEYPPGITLEQMVDSLRSHDRVRQKQLDSLLVKYREDSLRISTIRSQLDELPGKIEKIKKDYNEKRNTLITASTDSQLQFLSNWLSKENSNR